ncbi:MULTISPECIES: LL-diaminopimelate aminotransferase [unclassified Ruminococcus]|uniref:LL-diaminopimelate aminotransferase n=1 Tax=unclassified Ruminococcus TaxID=2608920 RepID=UPI00189CDFC4|nr:MULTISPECIES: LL-diaminopimelate aminotransferase [unclassified Ruminococcus]MDB8770680.1 LL-diaminopimelate aminotransferase [Ruminococcus sp. 1001136sp1]MDB8775061.1 LL-diaminopimelate aminotransferase [Ruminococcus sp. 1001136sp1]MDB8782718.1 LL-diaminopimelate aminotransferase [Ruminococcus sp. 1001136sp1]
MVTVNHNYLKLPGSYLFSTIGKKVRAYKEENPDKEVISLGIGDVTQPLVPAIIDALHGAVEEMAHAETFHGYAPDLGYEFLRRAIAKNDYQDRGCNIAADEIFVSDGAKSDSGNIQEIFGTDNKVAVCDPVYPVYVDTNVMAGRTGEYNTVHENFDGVIYMPCRKENGFLPEFPSEVPDLIYLCFPNNPTGSAITKDELQKWVDYANKNGCVIIYDAAYEAYISEENVPHSIYECEGARTCAIELRSFSKNAGFTGVRLGFTVIPKELVRDGVSLHSLWARRHGTKFNGAPYIVQKAGEAVYSEAGKAQLKDQVGYYMRNAKLIHDELAKAGFSVSGGVNAPYIWLETPDKMTSWEFFDYLLKNANVVGTPGSGFGSHGEGYFRLTAFGTYENTLKAIDRIKSL